MKGLLPRGCSACPSALQGRAGQGGQEGRLDVCCALGVGEALRAASGGQLYMHSGQPVSGPCQFLPVVRSRRLRTQASAPECGAAFLGSTGACFCRLNVSATGGAKADARQGEAGQLSASTIAGTAAGAIAP